MPRLPFAQSVRHAVLAAVIVSAFAGLAGLLTWMPLTAADAAKNNPANKEHTSLPPANAGPRKSPPLPPVGQGASALPPPVAEMRDAIIHAARSGNLDELLVPIQWNELPPDFGERSIKDTLAEWKKKSPDGSGRAWLALIINLLEAPYAVLSQGRDVENAKVYIWPAFAELPLDKLGGPLDVEFLRLVSAPEALRMKSAGAYDGYGLAISASGVWLAFKQTRKLAKSVK